MENDPTWTENFISVMEKKPVLYNKGADDYADREKKKKAWNEVCEIVVENWGGLSPEERQEKGNEIQRRWKNLRTCFTRELNAQKKGVSGQAAKKRRKYLYFDQLMFLLPTVQDRETVSELTAHEATTTDAEQQDDDEEEAPSQVQRPLPSMSRSKKKQVSYEDFLLKILQDKREEIDEDKTFLLSLLPAMKRMKEEHKCEAKIEMLRIISKYQFMSSHPTHHPQTQTTNQYFQHYPQMGGYPIFGPIPTWLNAGSASASAPVDLSEPTSSASYRSSTPSASSQQSQLERDP